MGWGLEIAPNKATGLYVYYSGLYAQKNATVNTDGTCCVGWGYPGASNGADRLMEEVTGGYSRVVWKHEELGSVQWGAQYAYGWLAVPLGGRKRSQQSQHQHGVFPDALQHAVKLAIQ